MSHCTKVTWINLVTWSLEAMMRHCTDPAVTQCAAFANCDARVVCSCQYVTSWWVDDGLMETSAPGNNIVMRGRDTSQDWARGCSDHQGVSSQTGITTSWSADNGPDTEQIQHREISFKYFADRQIGLTIKWDWRLCVSEICCGIILRSVCIFICI